MLSDFYDAIVVGGGPAGLACALRLVRYGVRTVLFEKKLEFGSPIRCGEMTNKHFAEAAGIELRPDFIRNTYPDSLLIARDRFEMALAETLVRAGGEIYTQAFVKDYIPFDGSKVGVLVVWNTKTYKIFAPVIVACDGIESKIAKKAGFKVFLPPLNIGSCYGAKMEGIRIDPSRPIMGLKLRSKNPHFWWIFPINETSANVGLGVLGVMGNRAEEQFGQFIEEHPSLKGGLIARVMVGAVSMAKPLEKPYGDGILVAGTAARMVDVQGGEGIIYALVSGGYAAETILDARTRHDYSAKSLAEYRKRLDPMYGHLKKRYNTIFRPFFGLS
jgi:flavin-dependent dehydrogenase